MARRWRMRAAEESCVVRSLSCAAPESFGEEKRLGAGSCDENTPISLRNSVMMGLTSMERGKNRCTTDKHILALLSANSSLGRSLVCPKRAVKRSIRDAVYAQIAVSNSSNRVGSSTNVEFMVAIV